MDWPGDYRITTAIDFEIVERNAPGEPADVAIAAPRLLRQLSASVQRDVASPTVYRQDRAER
jgi:hypothetical protein